MRSGCSLRPDASCRSAPVSRSHASSFALRGDPGLQKGPAELTAETVGADRLSAVCVTTCRHVLRAQGRPCTALRSDREVLRWLRGAIGQVARRNSGYHELVENVYRFHVPAGESVLEIGCGTGDLLAALRPSRGVGVDLSHAMVDSAARRYPQLRFVHGSGEEPDLGETFDVIVLSDLVPYAYDLVALFDEFEPTAAPTRELSSTPTAAPGGR